jgi:3-hydroxyisobutyrate dehydrogenase-like beta-hydroxyacid dehydrogenase
MVGGDAADLERAGAVLIRSFLVFCPMFPPVGTTINGFASQLMLKGLRLVQQTTLESGAPLPPLGGLASALYGMFCSAGHGELGYSAIIRR